MKLKVEENLLVISNKQNDLNEVLDTLVSKDSKKVAAFLVEKASLPRELRIGALRLVLNDYVKMAKDLVLSDEFMYRLNWYEKFSEYQLVNFWNVLVTNNSNVFDEAKEAVRFKKTFYLLLLKNAAAVELTDVELEELLALETPEGSDENFKEFMADSDGAFYDYECNFDGMSYEDFKTTLKKCSTVADIRNIAAKYDIAVPKRLKKEELVALVLDGLRRQGKADANTEASLKKMSAISLQRFAKVNGIKASTEMKKDDIIDFIMNRLESTTKAVRKPRIQLETLPELTEFKFSKDYLREVNVAVDDEDETPVVESKSAEEPVVEEEAPVEEVVTEEPVVEEEAPVEEVVTEEPVVEEEAPVEEVVTEEPVVEEEAPVEEVVTEEPVVEEETPVEEVQELIEEINEETSIEEIVEEIEVEEAVSEELVEEVSEEETPITTNLYNDELLATIVRLLEERDSKDVVNQVLEDNRFNTMVELYEKRIAYLEEMIKDMRSTPIPINVTVNYPNQPAPVEVVAEAPVEEVVEEETPVEEVVVEEPAVEDEVSPLVIDSTFETLSAEEKKEVVDEEMSSARKFEVIVTSDKKQQKKLKKLAKKQAKLEKIRAKNDIAIYKRAKRRAFWRAVKWIIVIAILLVLAAFTVTTLIDMNVITGGFADTVNNLTDKYIPFMGTSGEVRGTVTNWVQTAVDFVKGLFA